ncbi:UDP-N-acetylmuramate dehydrogenase [Nocardioides donggukensis]|uniref:UDP-N-acetylenolpyruvoylglucosamine reductase n=1 Tax=Nocardioides donggukensis TaxID=2774019 RepID=A0A927K6H8_9ACTN|nr:UDP-N-acetylmuramate dehydrogenase [Nocardioides donggukensis]MBD8870753.1 UDP-N-acetylmuramate dehydrogenase [Nocardioides donggukensis]
MSERHHPAEVPHLSQHTTLRLGGPGARWVRAETEQDLVDAVRSADAADQPVLLVAGGSNLVVADAGFPGTVVEVATRGVRPDVEPGADPSCGGVLVTVAAGESWDTLVARAVREGWSGIEALSGIPGSVGATPIQNVGAYGQEVSQTVASVRAFDRVERRVRTIAAADCGFGYRHSRFKAEPDRFVVLTVTFQLPVGGLGSPVGYAELARALDVGIGERAPLADVRRAVLALRAGKGMVLDADDHDTWSAGSFFTNPVLPADVAERLPAEAPRFAQPDGSVKTSAAWLIERAGFGKGYGLDRDGARVGLSTKHTLALTNRGGASTAELLDLAREVRAGVEERFAVRLVNEPVLVACTL